MSQTDRIEKSIVLSASRSRVWRALSDAEEFGRFALRKLVFPQEFHGEGFLGFDGKVLITEVGGHLIR